MNMAACDGTNKDETKSDQATEDINLNMNRAACDGTNKDETKSDQATAEPEGILQLIDKLEKIVDQMVPG